MMKNFSNIFQENDATFFFSFLFAIQRDTVNQNLQISRVLKKFARRLLDCFGQS